MDNDPDEEAPVNGVTELSIIKSTFIESDNLPVHYLTLLKVS